MSQLFFTKAAALRILQAQGIAARCVETLRVYKGAVQVTYRTKNGRCSTFLSKTAFYSDFLTFRQEGAKTVTVKRWGAGSYTNHYECYSDESERIYTVKLLAGLAMCSCPDYEKQHQELGKAKTGCKHVIAVMHHLGHGSLQEYMDAASNRAKADLFGGGWDEPIQEASTSTAPNQLVVAAEGQPRRTKPAPDPFGGFGF
ncbi:SWIM zinc finger family protein [Gloeocapsopsis dulcis]|uniref:SWIM-type domain-containing protein n=1 Tax=Gloeocapsopsis dulcis AAB1 = 1H9 TaxID=1433147 RepID=A0A6N8G2Y5_9CHRO|nr:SWIM zinc finger family protein [Gloeocapsopsis dulcis]MUL39439.1 hypothetical protein [Gloeocapsopsis dulcis AAB1 = 1H9]WNN92081.1 SWIM zinc finger domain-containing protein [Gloeocapsopsis dulcis]